MTWSYCKSDTRCVSTVSTHAMQRDHRAHACTADKRDTQGVGSATDTERSSGERATQTHSAAVVVVHNEQKSFVPLRPRAHCLIDILQLTLTLANVVARVVASLCARGDPRESWERPGSRSFVELRVRLELLPVCKWAV